MNDLYISLSSRIARRMFFLLIFIATVTFSSAQGKWVFVEKTLESNNKYWKADKNKFYWHNGSVYFLFDDPPATILFGQENDIVIPYTLVHDNMKNRRGDNTAPSGVIELYVTVHRTDGTAAIFTNQTVEKAHYEGNDNVYKGKKVLNGVYPIEEDDYFAKQCELFITIYAYWNRTRVSNRYVAYKYRYVYQGDGQASKTSADEDDVEESRTGQIIEKTTDASDTWGEDEGTEIPWKWIGVGVAVIGGGIAIGAGSKRKKKKNPVPPAKKQKNKKDSQETKTKEEEKEKEHSRYRMVLYKDFGDTLVAGDPPRIIGARIEEINVYGEKIDRPDLTERITIKAEENCAVSKATTNGKYKLCHIAASEAPAEGELGQAKVKFVFSSETGTLINHVVFKVAPATEIVVDEGITFEAGGGKTQFMEFGINNLASEVLGIDISLDGGGDKYFKTELLKDKEIPAKFRINITECGVLSEEEKKNAVPGDADRFRCNISAKVDGKEKPLEAEFYIYRMHLGVMLNVKALKAYLVDYNSTLEDEILVSDPKARKKWGESKTTFKLIAEDKKTGDIRAVLPDAEPVFTFEDIPEENVLFKDKFGNDVPSPCALMNFKFELQDVYTDNTVMGVIHSGGGGFLPPNRAKAKVTLKVSYNGKTYENTTNVLIISQPFREIADNQEFARALREDEKKLDQLINMRSKIAFDPRFAYLMPFYYKVDAMVEGYDNRFGFYEPDYKKMMDIFDKYCSGQIGYYFVNDAAWTPEWTAADENFNAFVATFASMEKSVPVIGLRIALAYFTAGASELVLMPYSGLVAMKKYVDKGGDSAFKGFVVANVEVFFWEGVFYVGGKAFKWARGTQVGQQVEKKVVEKAKAGWGKLKDGYKKLKEYVSKTKEGKDASKKFADGKGFSTNKIADKVKEAGKKVTRTKKTSVKNANDAIRKTRMKGDAVFTKDSKFAEECSKRARKDAQEIYDNFKEVMNNPNATPEEVRRATLALQGNKNAQNLLRNSPSDLLRANYNAQMQKIYSEVDPPTIKKLAERLGVPEKDIKVWNGATGNAGDDLFKGRKIGADRDVTFQVKGKDGKWVDIDENLMEECYAEAFNEYHYGFLPANKQHALKTLKKFDQATVHGELGKESYGKDLENIIKKELQTAKLNDPERVARTFEYKCKEWIGQGKACQDQAKQLYDMGLIDEAMHVRGYGEALIEEGIRQNVKQFKRILDPRITALNAKGVGKDYGVLYEKIRILEAIGNPQPKDVIPITLEEARLVLKEQYGTTLEKVVEECAGAIKEVNEYL